VGRCPGDQLPAPHPRLIYADITGFGETGPDANKPGFDVTAYWARSGLMNLTRQPSSPPALNVFGSGDHATSISLFAGIMTALYRREKTGQGSRVTASLIAEGAWAAGCWLSAVLAGASDPPPVDRQKPPNALVNLYRTADDRWLLLVFANEDKEIPLFLEAIGHPEAARDPRFADSSDRHAHAIEITALLDEEFATRSLADWRRILDDAGLTYGVAQTLEEAAHDPQLVADQVVVPVDGGAPRPYLTVNSPVRLDQEQKVRPGPAPGLGEHTRAVLGELGFDADAIERLGSAGAIPDRERQTSKP
jgi:formyl-CoA transferase